MHTVLRKHISLIGSGLLAAGVVCAATAAIAQPHRVIDGHISLCGHGTIPVRPYAAERYYARPLVCGGGQVNDNLNPDFQLNRGGR
jgi:hypothetical protein